MRHSVAVGAGRLAALVLIVAACSGTTIIDEGTLDSSPAGSNDLVDVGPAAGTDEPVELFAAAQIAALAGDCEEGDELACDILYQASALDSPEETLARSCGGRDPAGDGFCTPGIRQSLDGIWFDDRSPGLDDAEDACLDGDLTACDFLFFRSEIGSTHEEIGTTCGGRIDIALPDCRTALADD